MSRICTVTGKRPMKGRVIHRKGQTKKSGGIGTNITKKHRRTYKPNVQRVRIKLPGGGTKRVWVCAKALKAGKVEKAG
ncbi:MAG: 50S ribosomal protein L28 [Opitutales bacterium]